MNTQEQYQTDQILHDLFSTLRTESPAGDFTSRVMSRIAPELVQVESVGPVRISGRIWLAVFFSLVFFSLLFFTSDIPAFDFLNRYLDFSWLSDFTISDRSAIFLQKLWTGLEGIKINYILIPVIALSGLIGIDYTLNHKSRSTTFFSIL